VDRLAGCDTTQSRGTQPAPGLGVEALKDVILLDFTNGEARWITQDEMAKRMRDQHERGVRMTHEGFPLKPPALGRAGQEPDSGDAGHKTLKAEHSCTCSDIGGGPLCPLHDDPLRSLAEVVDPRIAQAADAFRDTNVPGWRGEAGARRIGICLISDAMFWWRADVIEACPECSTDDERYQEGHRFFVAEEALQELNDWVSRMPDAGFTSDDPRWGWWHERPR
jgi:hypothetical protein